MVSRAPRPAHHRLFAMLSVVIAAIFWATVAAPGAQAHDQLLSQSPASGSVSPAAPAEVVLTFSQSPMPGTVRVIAANHLGDAVALAEPVVRRNVVQVPWPASQPAGTYRVSWRVTSSDGHPINGTWDFTYGLATPQQFVVPQPSESSADSGSAMWVVTGIAIALAILVGAGALMLRLRRSRS